MKDLIPALHTLGIFLAIALLGGIITPTSTLTLLSVAAVTWFYFVLPGYALLLHLTLQPYERIILGTAVSAALVPLVFYTADILGIPLNTPVIITSISIITITAYTTRQWTNASKN